MKRIDLIAGLLAAFALMSCSNGALVALLTPQPRRPKSLLNESA